MNELGSAVARPVSPAYAPAGVSVLPTEAPPPVAPDLPIVARHRLPAGVGCGGAKSGWWQVRAGAAATVRYGVMQRAHVGRFDPSGMAPLGDGRFVVINDRGDGPQLSIHRLDAAHGALVTEAEVPITGARIDKLEAITPVPGEPGSFWISGSFEGGFPGDTDARMVRLRVALDGAAGPRAVAERLDVADPRAAAPGGWCKLEALAAAPDGATLYAGLRAVGERWTAPRYRATILAYDRARLDAPPQRLVDVDLTPVLGRPEGISAIAWSPAHRAWLVLTSHQVESPSGDVGAGGHLFVAPDLAALTSAAAWARLSRVAFDRKPEGVCEAGDGRVLVVFDEDEARGALGSDTAHYAVVDVAPGHD